MQLYTTFNSLNRLKQNFLREQISVEQDVLVNQATFNPLNRLRLKQRPQTFWRSRLALKKMYWSVVKQPGLDDQGWPFCCLSITQCPKEYESLQISKIACILQIKSWSKSNWVSVWFLLHFNGDWLPLQKRRSSKFIVPILQRWRRQIPFQWRFLQPSLAKHKHKY